jgi:transcriptional regulator with XRE-family HTH domain
MHVRTNLRDLRGKRSLRDMEALSGVSGGVLSQIERGVLLPFDRQIPSLEAAYGAPLESWFGTDLYGRRVLAVLLPDEEEK